VIAVPRLPPFRIALKVYERVAMSICEHLPQETSETLEVCDTGVVATACCPTS